VSRSGKVTNMTMHSKLASALMAVTLFVSAEVAISTAVAQDAVYDPFIGELSPEFATPEEALAALKQALASKDLDAVAAVLGLNPDKLKSFEGISDRMAEISAAAAERASVAQDGEVHVVSLGRDVWPFPFPITKSDTGKYAFNTVGGLEEVLNRRIGENERQAIATARAYVDAQRDYAAEDRDGDGVLEYAQKLISSEGQTDGLFWPIEQGDGDSPAGEFVNQAALDKAAKNEGYFGYRFRVLKGQGNNIAGGRYDYVINGNMIAGYGLIAYPVKYFGTGVMTFVVNHAGIVYEKDLGPNTEAVVKETFRFNPDESWAVSLD
jgi:hypothetical protein